MAEKKTTAKTAPAPAVETVENPVNKMIDGLVEKAQAALKEFLTLDQEQIDHIVHEMALAGLDKHQELARMAVEETGRGVYEDKVIKNMFATEYIWHDIKSQKTVGIIEPHLHYAVQKPDRRENAQPHHLRFPPVRAEVLGRGCAHRI